MGSFLHGVRFLLSPALVPPVVASEAAAGMLDVAFEEAWASTVTAVVRDGNEASAKLALRLGFRPATRSCGDTTLVLTREDRRRQSSQTDAAGADAALGMASPQAPWRGRP